MAGNIPIMDLISLLSLFTYFIILLIIGIQTVMHGIIDIRLSYRTGERLFLGFGMIIISLLAIRFLFRINDLLLGCG